VLRCLNVTCESEIEAFEELDLLLERDLGTEAVAKFMRGLTRLWSGWKDRPTRSENMSHETRYMRPRGSALFNSVDVFMYRRKLS
jgi:hypothetical protein